MCTSHCSWVAPHLKATRRGARLSPGSARRDCAREPRHARGVRYAVFASVCYAVPAAEAAAVAASAPDAPGAAEASASNTRAAGPTRFGGAPVSAPRRARARASAERQAVAHSCAILRCLSKLEEEAESSADAGKLRCMRAALQKGAEPFADSKQLPADAVEAVAWSAARCAEQACRDREHIISRIEKKALRSMRGRAYATPTPRSRPSRVKLTPHSWKHSQRGRITPSWSARASSWWRLCAPRPLPSRHCARARRYRRARL